MVHITFNFGNKLYYAYVPIDILGLCEVDSEDRKFMAHQIWAEKNLNGQERK